MVKTCFVIAPIGEKDSDIRKRSDKVLKYIFTPALKEMGYKAIRADHLDSPGIITHQVIKHIVDDDLVIADLTGRNPNVFYELAIRHATNKPLIQLIQKNEVIPFDIASVRTIIFDHTDLDSVEDTKDTIKRQIKIVEDDSYISETPITASIKLNNLINSENSMEYEIGRVLEEITGIRRTFSERKYLDSNINEILTPTYFNRLMDNYRFRGLDDLKRKIDDIVSAIDTFSNSKKEKINWIDSSLNIVVDIIDGSKDELNKVDISATLLFFHSLIGFIENCTKKLKIYENGKIVTSTRKTT